MAGMVATEYSVVLTAYEYSVLTKNDLISIVCKKQLESATEHDEGIELLLTLKEIEELTGFVAAESNHARTKRQREELGEICDYLEVLVSGIRRTSG
ncbi:MAG: hypothetical protein PVF77_09625 [Anaerolineae bacterium]|jgi:hypothetical protein